MKKANLSMPDRVQLECHEKRQRNLKSKKTHLMHEENPFSFCDLYLGDNPGMKQTFKIEEVTCKKCRTNASHQRCTTGGTNE